MSNSTTNKEAIYDEEIHPLMSHVIEVCKRNGIAMLCTFAIPSPEDEDLCCTSMIPDEKGKHPSHHMHAMQVLRGGGLSLAMTVTTPRTQH